MTRLQSRQDPPQVFFRSFFPFLPPYVLSLSILLSINHNLSFSVCLYFYQPFAPSSYLVFVLLSINHSICLTVFLSFYLSFFLSIVTSLLFVYLYLRHSNPQFFHVFVLSFPLFKYNNIPSALKLFFFFAFAFLLFPLSSSSCHSMPAH